MNESALNTGSLPRWEFQDKYLERLCQKAWKRLPEGVRNKSVEYISRISDDGNLSPQDEGLESARSLNIAKFNPGDKSITLFRKDCGVVSDDAIVGAFVHEVAHAFKTATLTDSTNPYALDAIEHAGDALPSGWSFSRQICALISERAQAPGASVLGDASRNLLSQAIIAFATGLLFLKSFSDNLQFLIAGLLMVVLSVVFLASSLGIVVQRLRPLRAFSVRYGTNLWFAFMIVSLARIIAAWGGTPQISVASWLSTFLMWAAPLWIYVFAAVFVVLAAGQTVSLLRYTGVQRGVPDMLVSLAWAMGTFAVFLLALTDLDIRWSLAMIGGAVVCLATERLFSRKGRESGAQQDKS